MEQNSQVGCERFDQRITFRCGLDPTDLDGVYTLMSRVESDVTGVTGGRNTANHIGCPQVRELLRTL
jgi:hypothetical protein